MNELLDTLFTSDDPMEIDELIGQIVAQAVDDPDTWRAILPPAHQEAVKRLDASYNKSIEVKGQTWLTIRAHNEGKATAAELLDAKAAAYDADEDWHKWYAIESELGQLVTITARATTPRREYVQ